MTKPTIELIEGFDRYAATTDMRTVAGKWGAGATTGKFPETLPTGRFGVGQAWQLKNTNNLFGNEQAYITHLLKDGARDDIQVGFAFQLPSANRIVGFVHFRYQGVQSSVSVGKTADNVLAVFTSNGGTIKAQGTHTLGTDWHWIEIYASVSGAVKVWLDGNLEIDTSGITFPTHIDSVDIGATTGSSGQPDNAIMVLFDDLYIALPADATTPLGDSRVEMLLPDANDSTGTFTNEGGAADFFNAVSDWNDDTYISSATANDEATFTTTDTLNGTPNVIHAVAVNTVANKSDASTRTFKSVVKDASNSEYSTENFLATSETQYHDVYETQPDGSSAWTKSTVEAIKFGVQVQDNS